MAELQTAPQTAKSSDRAKDSDDAGSDIFVAAQYGDWQRIDWLIANRRFTADARNEQGVTPLHWAAINDRLTAAKTLLDHGAEVDAFGGDLKASPLMWAAKSGHTNMVQLLCQHGADPERTDAQGYNALQLATHSSNIFLILYLLLADVAVDSVDPQGHTCLMWAAYQGDALSVDLFARWGANINANDNESLNALHWAVVRGNKHCIKRLVQEGIEINHKQLNGKTPRDMATELKLLSSFEDGLSLAGRDPDSALPRQPWLPVSFHSKAIFIVPHIYIGLILLIFSRAPIVLSLPLSTIILYSSQKLVSSLQDEGQSIHQTPYLSGIFAGSAFWTTLHWLWSVMPATCSSYAPLNGIFGVIFAICLYNFYRAMLMDPGFVRSADGSRADQRELVDKMIQEGVYGSETYCIYCLLRKPLRSKHCKICKRCVARHDHHCPWVNNCVGLRNHRAFMVYIIAMFLGIPMYAYLVYKELGIVGNPPSILECTLLAEPYCSSFQIDGFGILLAIWDSAQLTWVTMLLVVQLWQIARAATTQEVINLRKGGSVLGRAANERSASLVHGVSQTSSDNSAHHEHGEHCTRASNDRRVGPLKRIARLFGVDQFVDTAREGIPGKANRVARWRNPFDHGVIVNCQDFWHASDGINPGVGWVNNHKVDFYSLYSCDAQLANGTASDEMHSV